MNGRNQKIIIYGSSLYGNPDQVMYVQDPVSGLIFEVSIYDQYRQTHKEFIVRIGANTHSEYCRKLRRKLRAAHKR